MFFKKEDCESKKKVGGNKEEEGSMKGFPECCRGKKGNFHARKKKGVIQGEEKATKRGSKKRKKKWHLRVLSGDLDQEKKGRSTWGQCKSRKRRL